MSQTRFPKTVEFLRNAMLAKEGYDLAMAQELTQLVNVLGLTENENIRLAAMNETLEKALDMAETELERLALESVTPTTPQYPGDFYFYGQDDASYVVDDEEVQNMVDDVIEVPLEDGQFYELTDGDTLVIKLRDNGVEKVIVAKGYAENVLDTDADDDSPVIGCGDPQCDCHIGLAPYGSGLLF